MHDVLLQLDDNISDPSYQNVLLSALAPLTVSPKDATAYAGTYFIPKEDLAAMGYLLGKSTSKKERSVRGQELIKIVEKPLETFFEEKLGYYLLDTKPNRVMKQLFVTLATTGAASGSDLVDEMLRQVQKPGAFE